MLKWHGRVMNVGTSVEHGGVRYAPIEVAPSVSDAIRFPARVSPRETVRELFEATALLINCSLGLTGASLTLTTAWLFASWLFERLAHAPVLWIVASPQSSAHATLHVLSLLGRRSLRVVGVSRHDLCSTSPMPCTLVLDAFNLSAASENILRSATRPEAHILYRGAVIDIFSPKIICSSTLPDELWRDSEILCIALPANLTPIKLQDPKSAEQTAEEYQSRFLSYLLHNENRLRIPDLKASRLSPALQELAATLAAAMIGDEKLEEQIVAALEVRDEEARSERSSHPDAIIIESALFFCHRKGSAEVPSSEIATYATAIFSGRCYQKKISAEAAGWALKRLGIPTERLGSAANGIRITASFCARIHELAVAYDVLTLRVVEHRDCACCRKLRERVDPQRGLSGTAGPPQKTSSRN